MKQPRSQRMYRSLMISVMAHMGVLLCMLGVFSGHRLHQESLSSHAMQAHLASSMAMPSQPPVSVKQDHTQPTDLSHRVALPTLAKRSTNKANHHTKAHQIMANNNTPATPASLALTAKQASQLSRYLHQRIAMHAHFPLDAPKQDRDRNALISMMLYPDGHVEQLAVTQSSGVSMIDRSALAAVTNSAPFSKVSRWLHRPEKVVFRVRFM